MRIYSTFLLIVLCIALYSCEPGLSDCTQYCKDFGMCTLSNGKCISSSSDDCSRSASCTSNGNCFLITKGDKSFCGARSDAVCKSSKVCKTDGFCSANLETNRCEIMKPIDCSFSDQCQKFPQGCRMVKQCEEGDCINTCQEYVP